jgi:hypothetical protein
MGTQLEGSRYLGVQRAMPGDVWNVTADALLLCLIRTEEAGRADNFSALLRNYTNVSIIYSTLQRARRFIMYYTPYIHVLKVSEVQGQ